MQSPFEFTFRVYGSGTNNGYAILGSFNGNGSIGDDVPYNDYCEITAKISYPADVYFAGT